MIVGFVVSFSCRACDRHL